MLNLQYYIYYSKQENTQLDKSPSREINHNDQHQSSRIIVEKGKVRLNLKELIDDEKKNTPKEIIKASNLTKSNNKTIRNNQKSDLDSDINYSDVLYKMIHGNKSTKKEPKDIIFRSISKERKSENDEKKSISDMMRIQFNKVRLNIKNPESVDNFREQKFVNDRSDITKHMEQIKDEYSSK